MQRVTKPTKNCLPSCLVWEALRARANDRDDELTAIESNRQQIMESLDQAGWRLDALRLIVVTHQ